MSVAGVNADQPEVLHTPVASLKTLAEMQFINCNHISCRIIWRFGCWMFALCRPAGVFAFLYFNKTSQHVDSVHLVGVFMKVKTHRRLFQTSGRLSSFCIVFFFYYLIDSQRSICDPGLYKRDHFLPWENRTRNDTSGQYSEGGNSRRTDLGPT